MAGSKYARWIPGILVAIIGLIIARLLSPLVPAQYQSATFYIGTFVAIAGIFIAAAGSGGSRTGSK